MNEDTTALFEVSLPQIPSDIAADMLNSSLTMLDRFDCDKLLQVDDYAICDHAISLHQDLSTINKAVVGVLSAANISEAIIIYDGLNYCILYSVFIVINDKWFSVD